MRKMIVLVACAMVFYALVYAVVYDLRITTTREGTYLTREYSAPKVTVGDVEYYTEHQVSVYRDVLGGKLRKVREFEYSSNTDNTYDTVYWVVQDPKLQDTWNLPENSKEVQGMLRDFQEAGGKP